MNVVGIGRRKKAWLAAFTNRRANYRVDTHSVVRVIERRAENVATLFHLRPQVSCDCNHLSQECWTLPQRSQPTKSSPTTKLHGQTRGQVSVEKPQSIEI
jgi:hypothetical protein